MTSSPAPHEARRVAESFGGDAQRYDRARPPYPDELIARVLALTPGREVLDVGCGTGIAARQFQAAGCTVLGVDPDPRMAAVARAGGVPVETDRFEQWDPGPRQFDLLLAAQSWHWVDPAAGIDAAARVLRADGAIALFGHSYDLPDPVAAAVTDAVRRARPDTEVPHRPAGHIGSVYATMYDGFANTLQRHETFTDVERWQIGWRAEYTVEQWQDLVLTTGGVTSLPAEVRAEIRSAVGAAVAAAGGRIVMPWTTVAASARRAA